MATTAITLSASLTLAIAAGAVAQSTAPTTATATAPATASTNDPVVGLAISAAGSTKANRPGKVPTTDEAKGVREFAEAESAAAESAAAQSAAAKSSKAESDAPLAVRPVIRASSLIRPVTGTAAAGPTRSRLDIVDAGREDVGPLATSLRADPVDQRLPTGFDRVYRVPGSESLLMRGNGALFAVFEESVYRRSGAVLPPGTVFHIGMPDLRPTEYGLGHPPGEAEMKATAAVGRPGAIGNGPLDLRVRPAQAGSSEVGASGNSKPRSRAIFAPITLESALGIAPRANASREEQIPAAGSVPDAASPVGEDSGAVKAREVEPVQASTDPYASLRLGPARIARAE